MSPATSHEVTERITLMINGKPMEVDSFRIDYEQPERLRSVPVVQAWEGTFTVDADPRDAKRWLRALNPPQTSYWRRRRLYFRQQFNRMMREAGQ